MLANIPPEHRPGAIRLLQFLVHTKRPLKVIEAIEVIATQVDQEPRGFNVDGRLCRERDVLRYCPSLIVIAKVKTYKGVDEELHLAHFSVKEYLLEQAQFDLESASVAITRICLAYLSDIKGNRGTVKANFPMAQYAAKYWTEYAVSAETSTETVRSTVSFLRDKITFQRWTHLYQADEPWDTSPGAPRSTELYYACVCKLAAASGCLVDEGVNIYTQGGRFGNALQAAAVDGHLEVIQLLLDEGADVNAQGGYYGNALYAASCEGNLEVVQLLLDEGADIKAQGGYYGNALQAASYLSNLKVMQLLLNKGADVNAQGGVFGNALQAALYHNHPDIVQLLLDEGADVNAQTLQAASRGGNPEIVQLLNMNGAKMMSRK